MGGGGVPSQSTRRSPEASVMVGDCKWRNRYSPRIAMKPMGILMMKQNLQPQCDIPVKTPPSTGPIAEAAAHVIPTNERYIPRSLSE
jgi:hypothetical protein